VRNNPLKYVDPSGHEELAPSITSWELQIQRYLSQASNAANRVMERAARGLATSQNDIVRAVDTEFANPVNAMLIVRARGGSFAGTGWLLISDGTNDYDSYEAAEAAGNSASSGGLEPGDRCDTCYRHGGRTATNLTPRNIDIEGDKPGLSLTTTAGKGWRFKVTKQDLSRKYGFEIEDDPTDADPGHFVLRPGKEHIQQGWTLKSWANSRNVINENDPTTWHPLTQLLHNLVEPYTSR
jgi:hypothetical protein